MATRSTLQRPAVSRFGLRSTRGRTGLVRQAAYQALALFVLLTVIFPVIWVFSVSLNPLNMSRPEGLEIIPANATLEAYAQVIEKPTPNPISFLELTLDRKSVV